MSAPPARVVAAAASRRGPAHLRNEDAWCIYDAAHLGRPGRIGGLFAVCDGVSTAGQGKLAATLACERLGQFGEPGSRRDVQTLAQLVSEIDWELRGQGNGACCTLACAWIDGDSARVITIGDSPIYRLRRGRLKQAGSERTGTFSRRLRHYLGMGPAVSEVLSLETWPLEPGDVLLLLTDGILDALDEDELGELWARTRHPSSYVREVLAEVARIGVDDDATLIAVELRVDAKAVSPTAPHEAPDPPRSLTNGDD